MVNPAYILAEESDSNFIEKWLIEVSWQLKLVSKNYFNKLI